MSSFLAPFYSDVTADVMTLQIKVFRCVCVFFVPFFVPICFVSDRAKACQVTDWIFLSACSFECVGSYLWRGEGFISYGVVL